MTANEQNSMEVDQPEVQDSPKAEPYTPGPDAVDLTPQKDGGVLKEIKQAGTGDETPPLGSTVYVHYTGTLTNGTKFDSSRDRGEKFKFTLGKGNVIKAWDLGVATMKRGELSVLYCKSSYAYGENGSPPKIPPNATLVFEVELFDWKLEDLTKTNDGGILRQTLKVGIGYSSPNEEALVEISLVGRHAGKVFDQREVSFNLGEGLEHNIPEGVEQALLKFKKQERSLIKLTPAYGFGSTGNEQLSVPPNADLEYEVELKGFEKAKESWSMDADEKLEQAKLCKEKGTNHFKTGKYALANKQYSKIVNLLEFEKTLKEEKATEREQLMLAAYLNQAMCCLKLNDFTATRDHCQKALELDPKNEKGLFRLGQSMLGLHEPEEAKKHFEAILQFDSNNKAAANQVVICNAKIREQREKDKKLYSSIFNKMAENDRQKALRNKAMEMPEPTQWDNEESEHTSAVELKDPLDSVPCTESEDSEGSDEN
ncbi:Peptidyl-prolyl cis-trans isomerase FKBP4 [Daphnia magna]|uniref:peptidylprolyl isomerase n=1 Tax=Daphnia magna TaxID=35525 RepID=A0A0P5SUD9_9CRUS|nr:Peptidyl-prolyl cis-trans isomerase FKBP4 [Daphnia magna]